jgi:alcohol dehydrogenase
MNGTDTGAATFDLSGRTRVVFGAGSVDRLGELAREVGGSRALVVTQAAVEAVGHPERARAALTSAGFETATFSGVRENPTEVDVERCLAALREARADLLVAVGGGSSIDAAKGANFLLAGGGRMRDYWGRGEIERPFLPLIAVPTTAGTGSEVQSYALIAEEQSHVKMACGDPQAAPVVALLDPELTLSMPPFVTACTGMDAVVHAVESAVTTLRSEDSARFSHEAFRLAQAALPRVLIDPADVEARGEMLKAACFAGMAIELSMLGAAHSLANPLTQVFDIHHGQAVGMMLPHVVRFNAEDAPTAAIYAELARSADLAPAGASDAEAVAALAHRLTELLAACGLPTTLAQCGVREQDLDTLASRAAEQWTARFNPRPVGEDGFRTLYGLALSNGTA